jgi:hypothetical protein
MKNKSQNKRLLEFPLTTSFANPSSAIALTKRDIEERNQGTDS